MMRFYTHDALPGTANGLSGASGANEESQTFLQEPGVVEDGNPCSAGKASGVMTCTVVSDDPHVAARANHGLGALSLLESKLSKAGKKTNAPACGSLAEFLSKHARVLQRDGSGGKYSTKGRKPLELAIEWIDKILRNTLDGESVEIDGVTFAPGELKGATVAIAGGAQWGKTILELNLMAYTTAIRFCSVGCYLPDRPKVEEIVGQKFRPNVLDLYPWMAEMIQMGKVENASGKTIDRKESYTVTDGSRKAFGNFCGMHKPPTSITLDVAILDEVDDIPDRNIGYVSGRMTNSPVALTAFIGTQRVAGAGQNNRVKASSYHVAIYKCTACGLEQNLEETFPRCIRLAVDRVPKRTDPPITAEMGHNRTGIYYAACIDCGTALDRDASEHKAKHPERVAQAKFGVRVSQLTCSAISLQEIVGAWYAAFDDPTGEAMVAFYCDRLAIPNAGAAQPITQTVLDRSRSLGAAEAEEAAQPYAMSLTPGPGRFAGMDMGPRCWLWVDEVSGPAVSSMVWAELIASGSVATRLPLLMQQLGIQTVFLDAGGEPDLTKRMVLALNGLEDYVPPSLPRNDLLKSHLSNIGTGITWDGAKAQWKGIRAAAVLFTASEAKGVEQTVGWTQDGKLYPLIKCNRSESIQAAVNDFLTPKEGVIEMVGAEGAKAVRDLPRARLPQTAIGAGVSQALLDGHLLNLRKERDPKTQEEDWVDGVENHLGLSKVYARLSAMVVGISGRAQPFAYEPVKTSEGRMGRVAIL
jgi:hypothetical protein